MKSNLQRSLPVFLNDMDKYGSRISPHFELEDIHRFRTATKRLRSLLRWQEVGKKIFPASFIKSYHISGDLRNAQLLLIRLNKKNIQLPGFMLWLATDIGKLEHDWKKTHQDKAIKKLEKSLDAAKLQRPTVKSLQQFFNRHIEKVKAIIAEPDPADDALHDIRKMMKDMHYLRQWCKKNWPAGWQATRKFSILQLKKLADLAGNYNDLRTGLLLLEAYMAQEKEAKAIRATKRVQKEQVLEIAKFKQKLKDGITKFVSRFK